MRRDTETHFKLAGHLQLGRRDAQGVVHKHHGENGDEHGKVADDGSHLRGNDRADGQSCPVSSHHEPPAGGSGALQDSQSSPS